MCACVRTHTYTLNSTLNFTFMCESKISIINVRKKEKKHYLFLWGPGAECTWQRDATLTLAACQSTQPVPPGLHTVHIRPTSVSLLSSLLPHSLIMTTHSTWQTTVSFLVVFTITTDFNHDYKVHGRSLSAALLSSVLPHTLTMTTHSTWQTTVSSPVVFTLTTDFNHNSAYNTWQTTISCPALHKAIVIHTRL